MKKLDEQYIAELVRKSQNGSSNAFAELFTATYQNQYAYAYRYLGEEEKAKTALKETYKRALSDIRMMKNPDFFTAWLEMINFQVCYEMNEENESGVVQIGAKSYRVSQILKNLPMTESQVLVRHFYQQASVRSIKKELGIRKSAVKHYIKSGKKHLKLLLQE